MTGTNGKKPEVKHVLSVLVENHFGVLARISGLFGARGFNIDTLAVGETHDPTISRITLTTHGDERVIGQIIMQLNKLVDVIKVQDITDSPHVERELVLMKVASDKEKRTEIVEIVRIFKAKIIDFNSDSITIEIVGREEKISSFMNLMQQFGIMEMARTGRVALNRGSWGLQTAFQQEEEEAAKAAAAQKAKSPAAKGTGKGKK